MNPVHYGDSVCSGFRFGAEQSYRREDVTCESCLAAIREEDEPLAWQWHERVLLADRPAALMRRWVRRAIAWRIRHGGGLREARDAVLAEDWEAARAEDRLRNRIDQASEIERRAAAEVGEWSALLADATAMRRRLSAQLRLVQGVRGTPTPAAPVNAVQDVSRRSAPSVVANPYARHDATWPDGPCRWYVERPDGRIEPCGEPASSPVHG